MTHGMEGGEREQRVQERPKWRTRRLVKKEGELHLVVPLPGCGVDGLADGPKEAERLPGMLGGKLVSGTDEGADGGGGGVEDSHLRRSRHRRQDWWGGVPHVGGEEGRQARRLAVTLCLSTTCQQRPASGQVGTPSKTTEVVPLRRGPVHHGRRVVRGERSEKEQGERGSESSEGGFESQEEGMGCTRGV